MEENVLTFFSTVCSTFFAVSLSIVTASLTFFGLTANMPTSFFEHGIARCNTMRKYLFKILQNDKT